MASVFSELNQLTLGADGVYCQPESSVLAQKFSYSDGVETEQRLQQILSSTSDLSSSSEELEQQIVDWPSEYHLSSTRANLLRGLNLDDIEHVLELGCGCGSISRYLGEQTQLKIDSVEGSAVRAALAAQRCSDLDNVTISTGNFNNMEFPDDHYDLVIFVGVTEYAGRFSQAETDQDALQELLALAKGTAKKSGLVLIAIENRLGLKYVMGACEDQPFVGIDNYPESTGIRTYSKTEWHTQISKAGFTATEFAYPFPDYKVPTMLLADRAIEPLLNASNDQLIKALSNVTSRDYSSDFSLAEREPRLWQATLEARSLPEFSNSFLILLGSGADELKRTMDFDLLEFATPKYSESYSKKIAGQSLSTGASEDVVDAAVHQNIVMNRENRIKGMREEIAALQDHAAQIQGKLDFMANSRAWKWMAKLRRLFGRSSDLD